jgi:hypothetical protein
MAIGAVHQGDRIGRIFAFWAVFVNYRRCPKFFVPLFQGVIVKNVLICTKNQFGNILGDFFHKLIWSH